MNPLTIIVTVIIALLLVWIVAIYNRFVAYINRTKEAWADIDTQLKRRYDLIPNLINTVKGYAAHESQTLEAVIQARNSAINAKNDKVGFNEQAVKENAISDTLKSIFALSENYPDLKANQNFIELQRELSDTENKLQASRRFYNANVRDLNTKVETFPANIIAKIFKFHKMAFFELGDEKDIVQKPVEVKF
jgi:LemA protein